MARLKNELGNTYNRLTVIERAANQGSAAAWLCQCECGNQKIVRGDSLRSGAIKSCGCYNQEVRKSQLIDITGKGFGRLLVLKRAENYNRKPQWLCQCNCGTELVVRGDSLTSGKTQSCGCIRSIGEGVVGRILTENNVEFKKEYMFDDLKGTGGGPLRFDFAVFKNNELSYLIEFDGLQHYKKDVKWYKTAVEHDKLKNEYCKKNKIKLIRLREYEGLTLDDLM